MDDMSILRAPSNLPSLVKSAFNKAKASGDLTYYPTQVAVLNINSIPFQLRFSPSLASKPKPSKPPGDSSQAKPFNPFENPLPSMTIASIPESSQSPSHILVLNKFAIVPEHFILATKTQKPQTHVLEPDDLGAAWACIEAYRGDDQELYVFFNSGSHSGASQPHRHLQLLPVERMRDGLNRSDEWDVLIEKIQGAGPWGKGNSDKLPFTVLSERIPASGVTPDVLWDMYVRLYREAVRLVHPSSATSEDVPAQGEARISYNVGITSTVMALLPRTAEGSTVRDQNGADVGFVALNGTVLAGTALVKNQKEWDALRDDPGMLPSVLEGIGLSPNARKEVTGTNL